MDETKQVMIDVKDVPNHRCGICGGDFFIPFVHLRRISPLQLPPKGTYGAIPSGAYQCSMCGAHTMIESADSLSCVADKVINIQEAFIRFEKPYYKIYAVSESDKQVPYVIAAVEDSKMFERIICRLAKDIGFSNIKVIPDDDHLTKILDRLALGSTANIMGGSNG